MVNPQPPPAGLIAALSSSLRLEATLFQALEAFRSEGLPAEGVFVDILREASGTVDFLACATTEGARAMSESIVLSDEVMRLRRDDWPDLRLAGTLSDDPFTRAVAPQCFPEMKSFIMMRLTIESKHLGVVCFWSRRERVFGERHLRLLGSAQTLFALNVGFALSERLRAANERLESENRTLSRALVEKVSRPEIARLLAHTPSFASIAAALGQAGQFDVPVLLTGESGTGKEVVAETIHAVSRRKKGPFVRVNCPAIPEALMESEFFGHEAGAFTHALRRHEGFFEAARGGTLFLDEIGEISLPVQAKLLHALQNRAVRRVGGSEEIPVDVRVIAATNCDLEALVRGKRFRLDLFYRLNVLPIRLAPLRERLIDIEPLVGLFVREFSREYGLGRTPEILPSALREAERKYWPGNVRQLKNVVARTLLRSPKVIEALVYAGDEDRPMDGEGAPAKFRNPPAEERPQAWGSLSFTEVQRKYFALVLETTGGRIAGPGGAAERCGLPVSTLRSRLGRLGLVSAQRKGR